MTRRDIILTVLAEASGRSVDDAVALFDAMQSEGLICISVLDEDFSPEESRRMLEEFRQELPGIRRWLCEMGLLAECGHA
jgi:hypothetical protein